MRLGLNVGYWGLGLTAERAARARAGGRGRGLRLRLGRRGLRLRRRHRARLARRPDRAHQARLGDLPDARPLPRDDGDDRGHARPPLGRARAARASARPARRSPRAGTASASPTSSQRTREYVEIVRKALARERLEYDGEQYTLPLPDGPGKALKLMIGPVQERIPIYIAAIGPKNTQLTGEIADGWIPIFFSPEHVGESRELLEEGAGARGPRPQRLVRHRPVGERLHRRRHRPRPRLDAPAPRALRGRHGLAREELLQRARAPLRVRGRGADGAGPLPRRQEGRGRRGAARGADRHGGARAARATRCATGSRSTATRAWAR